MVKIKDVISNSPAAKAGIKAGEFLISVDGSLINDVLDYMFYADEEMGLQFDTFLMDKKRSCQNKCIFCFIDQLPKRSEQKFCEKYENLRETLYFKDDDSRLSFLQGNYITLTNLTETDVKRIIQMRTAINISVHTTNAEIRAKMLGNPKAGEWSLEVLERFAKAGISMNCQLVLCPGINDGDVLLKSLKDLSQYDCIESIACVPVGLTKFRDGLTSLRAFNREEALSVIKACDCYDNVFAADELYLLARLPLPDYKHYGDFPQYENGVGMLAYMKHTFLESVRKSPPDTLESIKGQSGVVRKTIVTGTGAFNLIKELIKPFEWVNVIAVKNNFFGESVNVSGLLTGADIIEQLGLAQSQSGESLDLGEELLISQNTLNSDGLFLDNITPDELEQALGVQVRIVEADGEGLYSAICKN
ncbi:MAG: DUF512 domain-containing protein [Oscillospiraceae bacterium]|nr:DUF512 domain-containing protein [Oscillospiraceae bacterium]